MLQKTGTTGAMPVQNLNKIKQMVNMMKSGGNPQTILTQMASQNPQMKQMLSLIGNKNINPKEIFFNACKQRGVNPDDILNMIKQ